MKEITSKEGFYVEISKGRSIAIFSADWCPDCQVLKPLFPVLVETNSDYEFIYVDRDAHIDLCQELDIFGIPSFIAFQDGDEIGRFVDKNRKTMEQVQAFIDSL